jgi:Fatty acid/phospholipid biosynthesis enzyme
MTIGLDMMGGDFAPLEAVKGALEYLEQGDQQATLVLIGDESKLEPLLSEYNIPEDKIKIVHAEQVIDMHEHPTKALKEKQKSSIAIGFQLLAAEILMRSSALETPGLCLLAPYSVLKHWKVYCDQLFQLLSQKKMAGTVVT